MRLFIHDEDVHSAEIAEPFATLIAPDVIDGNDQDPQNASETDPRKLARRTEPPPTLAAVQIRVV